MDFGKWLRDRKRDIVDVFDANTERDQQKRIAAGQPRYYQQQQAQRRQQASPVEVRPAKNRRPIQTKSLFGRNDNQPGFQLTNNSLTRGLSRTFDQLNIADGGRTWKQRTPTVNTSVSRQIGNNSVVKDFRQRGNTIGKGLATAAGANKNLQSEIDRSVAQETQAANRYTRDYRQGKISQPRYDALMKSVGRDNKQNMAQSAEIVKTANPVKLGAAVAETAFDVATAGLGGTGYQAGKQVVKQVSKQGVKGIVNESARQAGRQLARDMRTGAALGAGSGALGSVRSDQPLTLQNVARDTALGAAFGGAVPAAGAVVGVSSPAIRAASRTAQTGAQSASRTIQNIDNRLSNIENNPRVTAYDSQYRGLQRAYDNAPDIASRRRYSQAMAQNRRARAEEIEKIRQGGYVRNPFADDRNIPEQMPLFDRTGQSPETSVSRSNLDRPEITSTSNNIVTPDTSSGGLSEKTPATQFPQNIQALEAPEVPRSLLDPDDVKKHMQQSVQSPQLASNLEGASPKAMRIRPFDANNTTNIKVIQRGGEKKVQIGHITLPENLVGDAEKWKDVGSTLKTMDRNIEAAAPTPEQYRKIHDFIIAPRGEAVTRMVDEMAAIKQDLRQVVEIYSLKDKNVRADVMRFGEKRITYEDLVNKYGKPQADNIVEADRWFRGQYDRLLEETNAVLRKFKQPEIPRRENYYTHFSDDNLWSNFGLKMKQIVQRGDVLQEAAPQGARTQKIDPKLLGQSEFTMPNKRYNPFAQRRVGDGTKFDAVEAFERYLIPTLHNKHLTESVVKTRMLTKAFQYATEQTKNLPMLIRQLQEYGNSLAGKTNRFDRPFLESKWGNRLMSTTRYLQQQMGRNTILGSARSAIMQTASLPQTMAQAGYRNTALSLLEEMAGRVAGDDILQKSSFLRRRYADIDSVLPSKLRKAEQAAGYIFEQIEQTATKTSWRANYKLALTRGFKGDDAVREADRLTERVVAGRQIGERPEAFRSILGNTAGQFQLEVNNMVQQLAQDWKGDPKTILKFFAAAYMFNALIYEPLFGDKPLPDPVDAAKDVYDLLQNGNVVGAVGRFPAEILSNVPGGSLIAGLYPKYGANVAGVKLPSREQLFGDTEAGRYGGSLAALGALQNPEYLIPKSFGLKQVDRTIGGVRDWMAGENESSQGNKRFDIEQSPTNALRAALFGSYGTKEGKQYLKEKSDNLAGKESSTSSDSSTLKKQAKASLSPEQQELLELSDIERKKAVEEGTIPQSQFDALDAILLREYQRLGVPAGEKGQMLPKSITKLDDQIKDFYNQRQYISDSRVENWRGQKADEISNKLIDRASDLRPEGFPDLPRTNRVAELYADFKNKQAEGLSPLRENEAKLNFLKEAYSSAYDKDIKEVRSLGTDKLADAMESGFVTREMLDKAVELDDLLAGLKLAKPDISKKTREMFGYGAAPGSSSGGSKGRGKKAKNTRPDRSSEIADREALAKMVMEAGKGLRASMPAQPKKRTVKKSATKQRLAKASSRTKSGKTA